MKRYIIAMIFMASLLTGCKSLYGNYKRPADVKTDGLMREQNADTSGADSISLSWRQLFKDPHLVALIDSGLRHNADLQTARLRTEEAKATLLASKKALLPSVSFNPQGQVSSFDGGKAVKTYSADLGASWEVDAFGSLRNKKKGSEMALYQQLAYTQAVQTQLIATIAESYYTLEMLDRELIITHQTADTWEEYVRSLRLMHENSSTSSSAIQQNEASLLSVRHSIEALQQQIHEQENSLSTLVGRPAGNIERGSIDNPMMADIQSFGPINCRMLGHRPDVRQKEYALAGCFYDVNAARSAFYPNITLSGSAGWTNSNGGMIVNPGKMLLSAVASLTQPIFNKGRNVANLKIAQAQYEEAKVSFTQSLLDAGEEVNNALTQYQTAKRKQQIDSQRIDRLQEALQSTTLMEQNSNETNYLDVLTARQSLLSGQLNQIEYLYSEIESVISLYHALGGGIR